MIEPAPVRRLVGTEHVQLDDTQLPEGSIVKFWRWIAGDLRDNALRGEFAEWLVGLLLDIPMDVRIGWDSVDHRHNGVKIEVKSSGYIQGWSQKAPSRIFFGPLVKRAWNADLGVLDEIPQLNADWYVFALETCREGPEYNPLDLSQWLFYIVPRSSLLHLVSGQGLSLNRVAALADPMTAHALRNEGPGIIGLISAIQRAPSF